MKYELAPLNVEPIELTKERWEHGMYGNTFVNFIIRFGDLYRKDGKWQIIRTLEDVKEVNKNRYPIWPQNR